MSEYPRSDIKAPPGSAADDGEPRPAAALRVLSSAPLFRMALAAGSTVFVMFLVWEALEQLVASSDAVAHLMHYSRGISTSLVTAAVVAWLSYRNHRGRAVALEEEVDRRTRESREARQLLRLVVDATPAGLMVLDPDMRIVEANRMAEQVHGRSLTGELCYEALPENQAQCADCPAVETARDGIAKRACGLHQASGTGEILEVETHPLPTSEREGYVLLVEQVVTERKKLEARLLHQEKMAAFGLFAAEVAHDLGNPLSSIDAQLQLVDDDSLPEEAAEVMHLVREEVKRLHRILRELVTFARKRRDEASLVSAVAVVEDALRLLRHDPRMRGVRVVRDFDSETPPVFLVEDHLMQVVINLLMNSLDAMAGEGTLRVEIRPARDGVVVRVRDDGAGMSAGVLERCLEPLFTTKEEGKGTGLGLSIARDIIEAAGGEIALHSAVGHGTTTIITLPPAVLPEIADISVGSAVVAQGSGGSS